MQTIILNRKSEPFLITIHNIQPRPLFFLPFAFRFRPDNHLLEFGDIRGKVGPRRSFILAKLLWRTLTISDNMVLFWVGSIEGGNKGFGFTWEPWKVG